MNEFLAELYGTREMIGAEDSSDVEKLAEAQILDDVLQSEGIDVNDLDDGTILKLAYEIFGDDSEIVKMAAEEEEAEEEAEEEPKKKKSEEDEEQSAEEKTAEADMLGRIMAHSMVQELGQIEMQKEAGRKLERTLGGSTVGSMKGGLGGTAAGSLLGAGIGALKGGKKGALTGLLLGGAGGYGAGATAGGIHGAIKGYKGGKKDDAMEARLKKMEGKGKKASALDKLAEQRALAILEENGIVVDDSQDKLASAVEQRAWEMLAEAGYLE